MSDAIALGGAETGSPESRPLETGRRPHGPARADARLGLGEPRGPDFLPARPGPAGAFRGSGVGAFAPVPPAPWASPEQATGARPGGTRPTGVGQGGRVVLVAVLAAALTGGVAGITGAALTSDRALAPPARSAAGPANGPGDLSDVAARVQPSVVSLEVRATNSRGTGSGFVIDRVGHVLTNAHVVEGGGDVTVVLSDRRRLPGQVVGTDPAHDIAVVSVDAGQSPPPLVFGRSADVRVGDPVLAIGSPLGLAGTVTGGIVSAMNREVRLGGGERQTALQTDASINPGNSGGPLVNARGEVVGVNTAIATLSRGGSGSIGIGFAIPVDRAVDRAQQLIR
ncbi:S1C family serine protease [Actinomadura sp. HBU206391]|uniref:S1C family serine protease n=1 Tax=Actinomadura sp. HBU206391 TaxID=2731692 RepID=UPI001650B7E8|nr:trypsin-like peptidase domain-containing protein [Actinomadura sp. HBU206391]MBC6460234.1 trypsin-like peptidase domain-containing protein [Actinomadura sp. HBU206391]